MYQDRSLRELARALGMEDHPLVRRFLLSPSLPPDSPYRKKIEKLLRARAARLPNYHPFLPPPSREKSEKGWLNTGKVITGGTAEYPFRNLSPHLTGHVGLHYCPVKRQINSVG